jgi:hypothetical protein
MLGNRFENSSSKDSTYITEKIMLVMNTTAFRQNP